MIKTASSCSTSAQQAASEIGHFLGSTQPALVIYFSSSTIDPSALGGAMGEAFPGVEILGCTTAGELVDNNALNNSVVAMALGTEEIEDLDIQVINLADQQGVASAVSAIEKHFGHSLLDMDPTEYVGLILFDGLSGKEESVMDQLANLSNVLFVGGSAGDDLKFKQTHVFANSKAYSNAAVLALLKPRIPFTILKTQSFGCLPKTLVASKVNETKRLVLEFNNTPAAIAYAEATGVPVEKAPEKFMTNPVGLVIDNEPYVRSPQRIENDGIFFYCAIKEGMKLHLLAGGDIVRDTMAAIEKEQAEGEIAAILNFNCILRTLELQSEGRLSEYANLFTMPTLGFSTYGEAYLGHINQTSTMLVFKKK